MARLVLVLGGVRSGKSRFAEQLAASSPPVTYLATAQAGDLEMARRIEGHRQRRLKDWRTVEAPWEVAATIAARLQKATSGSILLECLTLWLTNLMMGIPGRPALADEEILAEVNKLVDFSQNGTGQVIVVSNEVGCGIIPDNALARRFGDILGEANQKLAAAADEVYACLAGIPLRVK